MTTKNEYCFLTARKGTFDKFSLYCKHVKRSKIDQLDIVIEAFLSDKHIPGFEEKESVNS